MFEWLVNLFAKPPEINVTIKTGKKIKIPKEHQAIVDNMRATHTDRNWKLIPVNLPIELQESPFWNENMWDIPTPHTLWAWLWIEEKPGRKGLFVQKDCAAVMDIWTRDDGYSLEISRMDADPHFGIKFYHNKNFIAQQLYATRITHLIEKHEVRV